LATDNTKPAKKVLKDKKMKKQTKTERDYTEKIRES
jgi:hypothetical protein